jgi:multicopper oxidase
VRSTRERRGKLLIGPATSTWLTRTGRIDEQDIAYRYQFFCRLDASPPFTALSRRDRHALGTALGTGYTQIATAPDYSLRIAPLRLEFAPGKVLDTFAYNGTVPGPALRLREEREVSIDIRNDTDVDDIVHWHALYVPAAADGAMEEGSPMVEHGGTRRYTFTAKPAGTRWYHSHDMAGKDLTRRLYSGMYGFLIVEPANDPGRYDQEVLLAAHHWEGTWVSLQDLRKGPPPDNGLEVLYKSASFNDKMLGHGEPIRVREGQSARRPQRL